MFITFAVSKQKNIIMQESNFKLIDSTYDVEDAKSILISLISDKIKSIQGSIFSKTERFGSDVSHLQKRVEELKEEKERLITLFDKQNETDNKIVEIDCKVNFKIMETQEAVSL